VLSSHSSSIALVASSNLPRSTQTGLIITTLNKAPTSTILLSSTVSMFTTFKFTPSVSTLAVLETTSPAFVPTQPEAQVTTISVTSTITSVSTLVDFTTILVTP
jgi:hypothetical protein